MTTHRQQQHSPRDRSSVAIGRSAWTWVDDPTESTAARAPDGPTQWPGRALGLARVIAWAKLLGG
jgi:hypothetical protein